MLYVSRIMAISRRRKETCIYLCTAAILLTIGYIAGTYSRFMETYNKYDAQHTNKPISVTPTTTTVTPTTTTTVTPTTTTTVTPTTTTVTSKKEVQCTTFKEDTEEFNDCMTLQYVKEYGIRLMGQTLPVKVDPRNMSTVTEWWEAAALIAWHLSRPVHFTCNNLIRVEDWGVCQDPLLIVQKPCLVYSFGINFNFLFDDLMGEMGCDVHSFDPSMEKEDHKHNQNVSFYNLGLGGEDNDNFKPAFDIYVKKEQTWKMRTLDGVVKLLGHEKRIIDVLKIDVETSEWPVLHNLLTSAAFKKVRHFLVEYHLFKYRPPKSDFAGYAQDLRKLTEMGFDTYYMKPHDFILTTKSYNFQGEVYYYNTKMAAGG